MCPQAMIFGLTSLSPVSRHQALLKRPLFLFFFPPHGVGGDGPQSSQFATLSLSLLDLSLSFFYGPQVAL